MAKKTQLERVHAALQNGYINSEEISTATGLKRKRVSDLLWHLKKRDYDLDAARAYKSALSMRSRNRTRGFVRYVKPRKSTGAPDPVEIGGPTIPVVVHVPTNEYGKEWIDPSLMPKVESAVDGEGYALIPQLVEDPSL